MATQARALLLGLATVLLVVPLGVLVGAGTTITAVLPGGHPGAGEGHVPDGGISVDDGRPAVARLDPALLDAVRRAAEDAARDGVEVRITSGWRSRAYQQHLLDEAIGTYGEDEARRRVATPDRSRHITGDALDVGPTDAAYWMSRHGTAYGLCQVYANEIWHYELLTTPGGACPPMRADSAS